MKNEENKMDIEAQNSNELSEAVAGWLSNTNDLIAEAQNNGDYTSTSQELIAAYWTNNQIV